MKKLLFALMALALVTCSATPQISQEEKEAFKFADELIKKMTLREKIGQLQQFVTRKGDVTGPDGQKRNIEEAIRQGTVGSFLSIRDPKEMLRLQKIAIEKSRLGIPLIFGYDIFTAVAYSSQRILPLRVAGISKL